MALTQRSFAAEQSTAIYPYHCDNCLKLSKRLSSLLKGILTGGKKQRSWATETEYSQCRTEHKFAL